MTRITIALAATLLFFAIMLSLPVTSVVAQDFKKGLVAAQSGDFATAIEEWQALANQGDADAQNNLGVLHQTGNGVPQDFVEAIKWYRLAAEQNNADAQNNLGVAYERGQSVIQDFIISHMWYNIASANGNQSSASNREMIAKKMTQAAMEKAQAMAGECMNSGYTKCGY